MIRWTFLSEVILGLLVRTNRKSRSSIIEFVCRECNVELYRCRFVIWDMLRDGEIELCEDDEYLRLRR